MSHALADLYQCVLDVPRMLLVAQVLVELLVGELTSEPGVPPEEEGHEHDEPGGYEKENAIARGHAAAGFGRRHGLTLIAGRCHCFCSTGLRGHAAPGF